MSNRDPKIDPQQGDRLSKFKSAGNTTVRREVTGRDKSMVKYITRPDGPTQSCWLDVWINWAMDADVDNE